MGSGGSVGGPTRPSEYPSYWHRTDATLGEFVELHDTTVCLGREREWLSDILNGTYLQRKTRDRRSGSGEMGVGIEVVAALRVENSALWKKYHEKREQISRQNPAKRIWSLRRHKGEAVRPPMPSEHAAEGIPGELDEQAKEAYLFHGTTPAAATSILRDGFRLDLAGSKTGHMFGKGIYLAEASSKADEYAVGRDGLHCMLVCRAACGESFRVTEGDGSLHQKMQAPRMKRYSSVLGDREAIVGTYREYVFYDSTQVYPEYAVIYRRTHQLCPKLGAELPILVDTVGSGVGDVLFLHEPCEAKGLNGELKQALMVPECFASLFSHVTAHPARTISPPIQTPTAVGYACDRVLVVNGFGSCETASSLCLLTTNREPGFDLRMGCKASWRHLDPVSDFHLLLHYEVDVDAEIGADIDGQRASYLRSKAPKGSGKIMFMRPAVQKKDCRADFVEDDLQPCLVAEEFEEPSAPKAFRPGSDTCQPEVAPTQLDREFLPKLAQHSVSGKCQASAHIEENGASSVQDSLAAFEAAKRDAQRLEGAFRPTFSTERHDEQLLDEILSSTGSNDDGENHAMEFGSGNEIVDGSFQRHLRTFQAAKQQAERLSAAFLSSTAFQTHRSIGPYDNLDDLFLEVLEQAPEAQWRKNTTTSDQPVTVCAETNKQRLLPTEVEDAYFYAPAWKFDKELSDILGEVPSDSESLASDDIADGKEDRTVAQEKFRVLPNMCMAAVD